MISLDTNLLLYALNSECTEHARAAAFLAECGHRKDVAVAELVLLELYQLLRNPAVLSRPLGALDAAEICQRLRRNPRWALIENAPVMERVWSLAATPGVARRKLFDARLGLTLLHHGVDEFATRNVTDFEGLGFRRVWNPLA
jgi:uncharacterized protein